MQGKGKSVEKGEALIEFDVPAVEERIKKLEEEIRILNLKSIFQQTMAAMM